MITEKQKKEAFRVAYDVMDEIGAPSKRKDYLDHAFRKIDEAATKHPGNPLLLKLLIAVYEYLGSEATGK